MINFEYEEMYEPTMADELITEYKNKMESALKDSVKDKISSIEIENARLRSLNFKLQKQINEIEKRENELHYEKENYKIKLSRMKLSELMKDREVVMYKVESYTELGEKCDKCDEKRYIHFKSPRGVSYSEKCECSEMRKTKYKISQYFCFEFGIRESGLNMFYYKDESDNYKDDEYYSSYRNSIYIDEVYKEGSSFEDIDEKTFFRTKEDCQKYCDYLNK
jgi:hypothetical protein